MAHLFSHKLLQETVKNVTIPEMEEKIAVLKGWVTAITTKSIYKKTESECEQAFNLDIFHKVLGYTFYPTEHYTLEAKGGNEVSGQKADATLGYFNASEIEKNVSLVQVAVEIKDANTSLTKSQRREGNLSPIQQGFKYKPQYNNCKWVIVTNFVEIRLFKDTQLDYELWNLVDLVNPENDYHHFRLFWYLLNARHLIASTGMESVTEKLLSAVRIQSEQITKKFYQEYKTLRLELINDIRKSNSEVSLDMVIQKAQKVIDRIVFVHFCEDFGLLPEGKLAEVIQYTQSLVGVSVWQILTGFFEAVNSGSQKLGIPNGYNGGLFHEDKELNGLKIGDHICQKFVELGKYDFQEELSVSILGHIFEQSISDLEDLRINLLGTELATNELGESTKSNKRKKDGIFYTPEYIVDYIVKNSLGKYLEEQFEIIEKKHLKNEKQMKDKVYQEKQKLIYGEYKQVLENITVLDPACGSGAFLVNVFDYLLAEHKRVGDALGMGSLFDNESTYKSILQRNIYGVDLNAESVEITKLSLWLKTAEKGKKLADLDNNIKCGNSLIDDLAVAGNKAFDRNKEFAEIMSKGGFDVIVGNPPYVGIKKDDIIKNYKYNTDLYLMFFEQTLNNLVNKSKFAFGFITPRFFLVNKNCYDFRKYILSDVNLTKLVETSPFEDAQTECVITLIDSNRKTDDISIYHDVNGNILFKQIISKESCKNGIDYIINTKTTKSESKILKVIEKNTKYIKEISISKRGLEVGKDLLRATKLGKKCLIGQDVEKYSLSFENTFINENHKDYLRLKGFFVGTKIYLRRVAKELIAYLDKDFSYNKNIYGIKIIDSNFNEKYILLLLNSKLLSFYYKNKFTTKKGDLFPEIQTYLYEQLPIKKVSLVDQKQFIESSDQMLSLHKDVQEKIDFTLRFFQSKFAIEKLSTKLQKFRELDFAGFLKELKVKKLPLDTEAELMRFFEKEKAEIVTLKTQIDALDKEIDDMVFDLYGLTEEERKVVLGV